MLIRILFFLSFYVSIMWLVLDDKIKMSLINISFVKKEEFAMAKWECPCGYVYDEEAGDPDNGIAPGTKFEELPDDWTCPVCDLPKSEFSKL